MDLGGWLRSFGFGKYEAAFRENDIDDTILPNLTHETLKDLGVTSVGHRLKLLEAIATFRTEASAPAPPSDTPPETNAAARDAAERRQVTVMFSDLVGSTALSARLDPEDMREVITAYQGAVAETVRRFGGFVAKYMGDGVLVYFGLLLNIERALGFKPVKIGKEGVENLRLPRRHCQQRPENGRPRDRPVR